MTIEIKNYTGHPITMLDRIIPSHGKIRLNQTMEVVGVIESHCGAIPLGESKYMKADIPAREEGTIYIVSNVVCDKHRDREDLYMPRGKDYINNMPYVKGLQKNPYFVTKSNV